jgi:hypothetical protein
MDYLDIPAVYYCKMYIYQRTIPDVFDDFS